MLKESEKSLPGLSHIGRVQETLNGLNISLLSF